MKTEANQSPRKTSASDHDKPKASPLIGRKLSSAREKSKKALPESTLLASLPPETREALPKPIPPASSSAIIKEMSAEDIRLSAVREESIDFDFNEFGKMSDQQIHNLKTALRNMKTTGEINRVKEFDISGQELGDHNVREIVHSLANKNLTHLYLDGNKLTVEFRKTIPFIAEKAPALHYLNLSTNSLGTGNARSVKLLSGHLMDLNKDRPSLSIIATDNNFSPEIVTELESQKKIDDYGDRTCRISAHNTPTNKYQPPQQTSSINILQSPSEATPRKEESKFGSDESAVDKTSRKDNSIWEAWRQALEKTVGDTVVVISSKTGRTFCCSPILSEKNRADLIELLQGSLGNPSDDEEITLDFADENGDTARLTRTMANIPSIAEEFIKTACIVQD
jgi:hypothetical protein